MTWETARSMHRGNIDDATPGSLQQERQGRLRTEKVTFHVQIKHFIVNSFTGIAKIQGPCDACIVHQDVESPKGLGSLDHYALPFAHLPEIPTHHASLSTPSLTPTHDF